METSDQPQTPTDKKPISWKAVVLGVLVGIFVILTICGLIVLIFVFVISHTSWHINNRLTTTPFTAPTQDRVNELTAGWNDYTSKNFLFSMKIPPGDEPDETGSGTSLELWKVTKTANSTSRWGDCGIVRQPITDKTLAGEGQGGDTEINHRYEGFLNGDKFVDLQYTYKGLYLEETLAIYHSQYIYTMGISVGDVGQSVVDNCRLAFMSIKFPK